jgi:CBS domain containing-hemolysin-like protein
MASRRSATAGGKPTARSPWTICNGWRGYQTLAGLVLQHLDRLPVEGDSVEHAGYRLEVQAMDRRRITRLRVHAMP